MLMVPVLLNLLSDVRHFVVSRKNALLPFAGTETCWLRFVKFSVGLVATGVQAGFERSAVCCRTKLVEGSSHETAALPFAVWVASCGC